jgi:hypothetical protein
MHVCMYVCTDVCIYVCIVAAVQTRDRLREWFDASVRGDSVRVWADDREVLAWMSRSGEYLDDSVTRLRRDMIANQVQCCSGLCRYVYFNGNSLYLCVQSTA